MEINLRIGHSSMTLEIARPRLDSPGQRFRCGLELRWNVETRHAGAAGERVGGFHRIASKTSRGPLAWRLGRRWQPKKHCHVLEAIARALTPPPTYPAVVCRDAGA
jgi:hypothetical protein